jgi:hypothetical protein
MMACTWALSFSSSCCFKKAFPFTVLATKNKHIAYMFRNLEIMEMNFTLQNSCFER